PATPIGITLVNVEEVSDAAPTVYLWSRFGDATGLKTLLTYEADTATESRCQAECAKDFPPVLAETAAIGFGDWSLVKRADGSDQWAYKGKPLYTFAKETRFDQVVDSILAKEGDVDKPPPDALTLPAGWSAPHFEPEKGMAIPASIEVQTLAVQDGMGGAL